MHSPYKTTMMVPAGEAAAEMEPISAHVCPPPDPAHGSDGGHAWVDIDFIAAATSPAPSWSSLRYVRYVS